MPKDTIAFLRVLAAHKDRTWFEANRDRYKEAWLEPAVELAEVLGDLLQTLSPDVAVEPRVNGSIGRINRDVRFSKDKRPYKDHLDLWFWVGDRKRGPGFWFRLTPDELLLGGGMHHFEPPQLERYRTAVADDDRGGALLGEVERLRAAGYAIGGERYKRRPRGFDAPEERAPLLLHEGVFGWVQFSPPTDEVFSAAFPRFCAERFRPLTGLVEWLAPIP